MRVFCISISISAIYTVWLRPTIRCEPGTWTMDSFVDMVQTVAYDLNGDGVWDGHDRYGLLSETSTFFISGCDVPFTTKDEDGYLTVFLRIRTDVQRH